MVEAPPAVTPRRTRTPFDVVCLSPHYDDAVLSCGGMLHRAASAGRRVLVVTVCAAPPPAGDLSPYAERLHRRWGATDRAAASAMVARRRTEDAAALSLLGAETVLLDLTDAIYRRDPATGDWLYVGHDGIFGPLASVETPVVDALAGALAALDGVARRSRIVAPLAVGGHVDHQLVRRAAEACWGDDPLRYYEDYPYAERDTAVRAVVDDRTWRFRRQGLDDADVAAKVAAVGAYASQISTFWTDRAAMETAVRAFAASRGRAGRAAERIWRRVGAPT
jgi:LmbE family N-acetylglucosaminyl deacetylase